MPIKIVKEGENERELCVLSYSSYSTFKQCPHRYYLEKIAKVPLEQIDVTYTIPGRIVHDSAAHFFETGSLEKFDPNYLRSELLKNGDLSTVDYKKAYGSFDKAYDLLIKSANNLQMFLITREKGKQFMSEKWFGVWNAPLYLSDNLAIQGAADLIELNPNGTAILYDFKTTWNTKNVSRDQLILYAIAVKKKWDVNVTMASFFLLPANKQDYYTITEQDKADVLDRFQRAADQILKEKENLPCTKNDKCKWCPFYAECEACKVETTVEALPEGPISFNFGAEL